MALSTDYVRASGYTDMVADLQTKLQALNPTTLHQVVITYVLQRWQATIIYE